MISFMRLLKPFNGEFQLQYVVLKISSSDLE